MPSSSKPSTVDRIGRADPVISMGQRLYDLISAYWPQLTSAFVAGGGMSGLAYITEWAHALGPVVIGGVGLSSALLAWVGINAGQASRAKRRLRDAEASAVENWSRTVDAINPLAKEYHTKRINILDIASPINNRVSDKRFLDCEMIGPSVIVFVGTGTVQNASFVNCDFAIVRQNAFVQNVTVFENCNFIGGIFWKCTIFMPIEFYKKFGIDPPLITLSGDPEIDSRPPQGIGGGIQR